MDSSIWFGLLSAFAYGAADYLSQVAGRQIGAWRATLYYYALGFVALSVALCLQPFGFQHLSRVPLSAWLIAVASGLLLLAAVVLFTQGLIKGSIAVVAPVMASYGAVTTLLSLLAGERFSYRTISGIALTIAGACGAAVRPAGSRSGLRSPGLGWACSASLAYGIGFWLQGYAVPAMGPLLPIWTVYAAGLAVLGALQAARFVDLAHQRSLSNMTPALASAILGVMGFVALNAGLGTGRVAVVVVLSSLSTAVTVILARVIDDSRMAWHQWLAVGTVMVGLSIMKG